MTVKLLALLFALVATSTMVDSFAPSRTLVSVRQTSKHLGASQSFASPSIGFPMKQDTVLAMSSSDATNKPDAFVAVGDLFLLTEFFKILFIKFSISFPASLAGCGALFSYFILGPAGSSVHSSLAPGAAILAKWLPVMFVPSLIALPLAGGLGSRAEVSLLANVVAHVNRWKR